MTGVQTCALPIYLKMVARKLRIPKIMKAAAGPHHLGTGGYGGEGSPIQAQHDSDSSSDISSSSLDGHWDNDTGSVTSIESGSDTFIHNPTTVRYFSSCPPRPF